MKVAVLVTGLPRFIDEGAWWFNYKSNYPNENYKMDFLYYYTIVILDSYVLDMKDMCLEIH